MKILTNIHASASRGTYQMFSSFLQFLRTNHIEQVMITAVDIQRKMNASSEDFQKKEGIFTLISTFCNKTDIHEAIKTSNSLKDMENFYREIIVKYRQIIMQEKPDLILLNGTVFSPWCLLLASRNLNIPIVLHYHGILTKEVVQKGEREHLLVREMEKSFDLEKIFYVFPSRLAKRVVENEIFGHRIKKSLILPNPVSKHFFNIQNKNSTSNVGIVSRWSRVKNWSFIEEIGEYNLHKGNKLSINVVTNLKQNDKKYKKLSDLVKLREPMHNRKLARFYYRMGIVMSPSHFETYGNVAQEALAANTPALVSSQMGVAETFKKLGLRDWIIDFNSVADVYKKIKEVRRQKVALRVRRALYSEYSPERIHTRLLTAMKSV